MSPAVSGYEEVKRYLAGLKRRGVRLGLDRMRRFTDALGHPEKIPCVHIAGTNGKGSVAAMLEAGLRAAGWRTGLYTSPHLVKLGERVQVNRRALTEAEIVAYTHELRPIAARLARTDDSDHPSYFEFMTAMALVHFARTGCDFAVVEVGLGGRLDATNVVVPEVSAILARPTLRSSSPARFIYSVKSWSGLIRPAAPWRARCRISESAACWDADVGAGCNGLSQEGVSPSWRSTWHGRPARGRRDLSAVGLAKVEAPPNHGLEAHATYYPTGETLVPLQNPATANSEMRPLQDLRHEMYCQPGWKSVRSSCSLFFSNV